jgi:FkbM family methyltransferase
LRTNLKLTRIRIRIANILYKLVKIFYKKDEVIVIRKKITYALNLSEGIDLSIFLFGNFQNSITDLEKFNLPDEMVIFDIGANIGSITLKFAQKYKASKIYSFEPTDYAYEKLLLNIKLNPSLGARIKPMKLYFSERPQVQKDLEVYSSWKVDNSNNNVHPLHGGNKQRAKQISITTLDNYCNEYKIDKLDFIKIDTDGHELPILKGGEATINKLRPIIVFEVGQYLLNERFLSFDEYFIFFENNNYKMYDLKLKLNITRLNYSKVIPGFSTIDIVAIPVEKLEKKYA